MAEQTEPTAALDAERLIALLKRQSLLYSRLRDLSTQQRNLISGDRPELLLSVLTERQTVVTDLARNNNLLAPFRRQWDELFPTLPEAVREQARALLAEINEAAGSILRTDEEDYALLSARREDVGNTLRGLGGAKTATTAYGRRLDFREPGASASDITG